MTIRRATDVPGHLPEVPHGRKRTPGLFKRRGIWHIDKQVQGRRIQKSTGTARLEEAERYLARLVEEHRQAKVYGVRPPKTFEQAAAKFVLESQHKRSLRSDIVRLENLMPGLVKRTCIDCTVVRYNRGLWRAVSTAFR